MTDRFDFSRGSWNKNDFWHAGIHAITHRKEFDQEDDCISNGYAPEGYAPDAAKLNDDNIIGMDRVEYAFTFYICKKKLSPEIMIESDFSFKEFGSPTFTYGLGVVEEKGFFIADTHVEVTFWEEGINYWYVGMIDGRHDINLLKHDKFKLCGGRHRAKIIFRKDGIEVDLDGRASSLEHGIFGEGYVGFIGCEGMNRFYDLTVTA